MLAESDVKEESADAIVGLRISLRVEYIETYPTRFTATDWA